MCVYESIGKYIEESNVTEMIIEKYGLEESMKINYDVNIYDKI